MDQKLRLGTEGYSPAVLRLLVRQAGKAASFKEASDDLRELARLAISPHHLGKLAERVGREWAAARDQDVQAFQKDELAATHAAPPQVATVMVDGGRVQTRADGAAAGVTDPAGKRSRWPAARRSRRRCMRPTRNPNRRPNSSTRSKRRGWRPR